MTAKTKEGVYNMASNLQKSTKSPTLATILSFFFMGLGQIYNGQIGKGIIFIILYGISIALISVRVGYITTPILLIWGMVDAYKTAKKIKEKIWKETIYETEFSKLEKEIVVTKGVNEQQLEHLKKHDKELLLKFFSRIYEQLEADKELEEVEIEVLQKIQKALGLTNEEIKFDECIRPYIYVNMIKKYGELPSVDLQIEGGDHVILKKGEIVHFADKAILKELKSVSLGYSGGSHGITIRVAKGIRYRVGAHRGHIVREDRFVESSRGVLLITNQRLFLHPFPGYKPLSIPLNKILSYHCYNNGIEVYKEGRERGYFFSLSNSGSVEIFGLCLSHLLKN